MNFTVSFFFFFFIKFPDRFHPTALPSPLYIPPFLLYFIQFHFRIDRSTYIYEFQYILHHFEVSSFFFFYHSILPLSPLVSSNRNVLKIRKRVCWPRLAKTSFVGNHVIRFTRLSSSTMSIR